MTDVGVTLMPPRLSGDTLAELREAVAILEADSFASRLSRTLGGQVRALSRALPQAARNGIAVATETALKTALRVALRSLGSAGGKPHNKLHQAAAAASGAIGGAFGFAATLAELPVSTTILLRSVAEIARANGEDLADPRTGFACLDVLGLGADRPDGADSRRSRYYLARDQLASGISEIDFVLVKQGLATEIAPMLTRYFSQLAARFGVMVTEKVAAQAAPVVGAFGGAAVNTAFARHFQAIARGHFTVRRLERRFGEAAVRFEYERLSGELARR